MLFISLGRRCTIENHCNLITRRHTVEYSDIDPNSFCIPIQHSTRRTYSYYFVVDDTASSSIPISNLCTHGACKHTLYCPLTAFCMTLISSGESCCTTAEKLPVFRAAHSLKNVIRCVYHHHRPASAVALCSITEQRMRHTRMSMVETGSLLRSSSSFSVSASSLSNATPRGPSISDRNANSSALKPWWSCSSSVHSSSWLYHRAMSSANTVLSTCDGERSETQAEPARALAGSEATTYLTRREACEMSGIRGRSGDEGWDADGGDDGTCSPCMMHDARCFMLDTRRVE